MSSNKKTYLTFFILLLLSLKLAFAGEGMWIPSLIESQVFPQLKNAGYALSADDIYSVNKACLKDAVIIFGGGCTGVCVSEQGLLFTNYHCSEYFIQKQSTKENDLIKNGYWSQSHSDELPMIGLTVEILESIEDVTSVVLLGISSEMTIAEKQNKIDENSKILINAIADSNDAYNYAVESFYYDNQFFLFKSKIYKDIRLVAAPPASLGSFGHYTDNWMWPRHSPDFAVFRIYADSTNAPVVYSETNMPYTPKRAVEISTKPIQEGDFTMILGYPGKTEEYLPSVAIQHMVEITNKGNIELRQIRMDIMSEYMKSDEDIYLKYYAKQARLANYLKKMIGETIGIEKTHAIQQRVKTEEKFVNWVHSHDTIEAKYKNLLPSLLNIYDSLYQTSDKFWHYYEGLYSCEIVKITRAVNKLINVFGTDNFERQYQTTEGYLDAFYKNMVPAIEIEITAALLKNHIENNNESEIIDFINEHNRKKSDLKTVATKLHQNTILFNEAKLRKMLVRMKLENESGQDGKAYKTIVEDVGYEFGLKIYHSVLHIYYPQFLATNAIADSVQSIYMKALIEKDGTSKIYPDANGTLRLTFGKVEGYSPADAIEYDFYTTIDGMLKKALLVDENADYALPNDFIDLIRSVDSCSFFPDGIIRNCFIASNHTSGGNSGSPVFDAKGRLIGINFDRNWDGTMSDLYYDETLCRNIAIDIRFILFILKEYGKTEYLFDEFIISN